MKKPGSRKPIDRLILWKLARMKKGEYDDVTRPVVEKIVSCQNLYFISVNSIFLFV